MEYLINKNKPKKLKAWELLKRLDELGEKCVGERYRKVGHENVLTIAHFCDEVCYLEDEEGYTAYVYGDEVFELIEEKFCLQDEFIARTSEYESYLNMFRLDETFITTCKLTSNPNYQYVFTNQDIVKYSIPRDRYKKIPVKHGE